MSKAQPLFKSESARLRILELYDKVLGTWPTPNAPRSVDTSFGETFVIEAGERTENGLPVVLLHGSGGNSLVWGADIPVLMKRHRVCTVDIVGEPGKSAGNRLEWDGAVHTKWLDEVLDRLGYGRVILAGISYGGWISLNYAVLRPDRVARLALVCPGGLVVPRASYVFRLIFYMLQGEAGKKKLKQMFFGDTELGPEAAEFFELCEKNFVYRQWNPPVLPLDQLDALSMPVLYLAGGKDEVFDSFRAATRLKAAVPHSVIRIVADHGHVFTETASELSSFIASDR